jgi:hypothetical protein
MKQPFNLDDLPRKLPYSAPERYFDELPGLIQNRIQRETPAKVAGYDWAPRISYPRLRLAVASLVLAVTGSLVVILNQAPATNDLALSDFNRSEVIQYLAVNEVTPETADLAEISSVDQSLSQTVPLVQTEDVIELMGEEEIEDYLL